MSPRYGAYSLLLAFALKPISAWAQVDRSALSGAVRDPAGRLIPAVHLIVTENSTGLQREAVSSGSGTFDIPELSVGTYTVRFAHTGFAPLVYLGVVQTVGQTRTLNATMKIAVGTEQVQVDDQATEVNQNSDALGARIEGEQIKQLPLNGRNWSTLTALVPGAVDTGGSNQRSIRFAGRGLDDNNFTYDGVDATNIVNQAQQPFVRLAIPTNSIEEFRVNTALFTAEQGSTPGGQIAVVSRAGGNRFHGNVFEFFRNSRLDAREPLDTLNPTKPPFRLNQFGGSLGGPIVHERTFFFATYEGLRQTLGQTLPGYVPSAAQRAQIAALPGLAPILNAYPMATIASPAGGQPNYVTEGKQLDHEDSGVLRLDHSFTAKDTTDLRFSYDAALSKLPLAGGGTFTLDQQLVTSRPVNGVLDYLHIFNDQWVNEAKFGFNRGNVYTTNVTPLNLPYAIAVSGFTTLNNNEYKIGVGNSFSEIDNLTWIHRRHTVKFGAEVRRIELNQGNTANGTVSFPSFGKFASNSVSSASYAAPLPVNGLRKTSVFSFLQDEWKPTPEITLNFGLRYSFFNLFHEVNGKANPFDFNTCGPGGFCGVGASFGQPNYFDADPRLSAAWAPRHLKGKIVLRSGFGLYHGDGQLDDQNLPISNEVARYSLTKIPNLSFPVAPFLTDTPGIISPRDDDRVRRDEYVAQWGTSVQVEVGKGWVGTGSYVGSKGTYLLRTSYTNLLNPATGTREYAGFGQVETRGNANSGDYNALALTLRHTFSQGFLFQANYVYSHEIDQDAAGGGDSDFPENPACFPCERASGDFDVREVLSGDVVYLLPYGRKQRFGSGGGLLPALFGNWEATSIVTSRTGLPVNITADRSSSNVLTGYTTNQRPDLVPGVPLRPIVGFGVRNWINPAAFSIATPSFLAGNYGDAGRNLLRAPSLWQADVGVARNISFKETTQLQFRAEVFNLFNRAQYGSPLSDLTGAGFGTIQTEANTGPVGTGTPRQVQLLLELSF